jgi:hypothetical protein
MEYLWAMIFGESNVVRPEYRLIDQRDTISSLNFVTRSKKKPQGAVKRPPEPAKVDQAQTLTAPGIATREPKPNPKPVTITPGAIVQHYAPLTPGSRPQFAYVIARNTEALGTL